MDKIQLPPTEAQLKARAFCDTVIAEALAQAVREGVYVKTDEVQWTAETGRFEPVCQPALASKLEMRHEPNTYLCPRCNSIMMARVDRLNFFGEYLSRGPINYAPLAS